jgi:beta-glucosidase
MIASHIRFGRISYNGGPAIQRATWANNVQELCEATALGIPFVISQAPSHTIDNGRTKAAAYSLWPYELGFGADGSLARAETFGQVVSRDFRAVGARMALGIPADLATDPRWYGTQFTFGEDSASVSALAGAYVAGLQGASLGAQSVAAVVGHFPGAGARQDGWDGRLAKGKYLTYPGDNIDAHLAAFSGAFAAGVAAVMPAYGIPETGSWSGLDGLLDGTTIEQVAASFNDTLINGALRGHYLFGGLVLAPWGVLEASGVDPLGAPWGVETLSQAERVAAAVNAGVDQFGGLADTTPIATALGNSDIDTADVDAAAGHALVLMFDLGLFEDPYVDPSAAPGILIDSASTAAALASMNRSTVLLLNEDKPAGFLNGNGDGTQTGDPGNAGNGSGKVLPAPPGQVYVTPGCSFYMMGNVDWDFVLENSAGYGELTNYATSIAGCGDVSTPEEKIGCSNYVFVIVAAPYTADPDSGPLLLAEQSLEYASNANAAVLDDVALARSAIDAAGSDTQLIVAVDAGRPAVISEIMTYAPAALLISWGASTKAFLDVVFGISSGLGTLPVGLPLSDAAAATQLEDVAGDGQHATFVRGFGLELQPF